MDLERSTDEDRGPPTASAWGGALRRIPYAMPSILPGNTLDRRDGWAKEAVLLEQENVPMQGKGIQQGVPATPNVKGPHLVVVPPPPRVAWDRWALRWALPGTAPPYPLLAPACIGVLGSRANHSGAA